MENLLNLKMTKKTRRRQQQSWDTSSWLTTKRVNMESELWSLETTWWLRSSATDNDLESLILEKVCIFNF